MQQTTQVVPIAIKFDREGLVVILIGGFEISSLTVEHYFASQQRIVSVVPANKNAFVFVIPSHPFDDFVAKETLGTEHKKDERKNISEPVFGRPANDWANRKFKQFFAHADDQSHRQSHPGST